MNEYQTMTGPAETGALAAAVRAGDEAAFNVLAERHRRELLVHCYRMLGSLHDAEDAVQDTFLRAWRYRESLKEGAPPRPWLYRVATNSCLDAIARDERRAVLAAKWTTASSGTPPGPDDVTWLQPIPNAMLEPIAPRDSDPEANSDPGDDRNCLPDRDPAPHAAATGGADPARRIGLVREGDR